MWITLPLAAIVALAGFAGGVAPPALAATPSAYYVGATGHVLAEPFLGSWKAGDGFTRLGLPVTDQIAVDGRPTQFFQFSALERASASRPVHEVAVGSALLDARHDPDAVVAGRRVGGDVAAADAFARSDAQAPTTYALKGRLKGVYDLNGSKDRFGEPISEPYNSAGYRVQWFQFGRLASRIGTTTGDAAPTGLELAHALHLDTAKVPRAGLPLFDPDRFRTFHGDGTVPEAPGRFPPVDIVIPSIGVNANVEQVGIEDGVMGVPQNVWNVGWYPTLSFPGDRTNVVMAGHRDWWGIGPTVFWDLGNVSPGDMIYLIGADKRGATYTVTDVFVIDANADARDVIGDTGKEALTLITCAGVFDGEEYQSRQIIRAERI